MRTSLLPAFFALGLTACPEAARMLPSSLPDCEAITEACHYVDPGSGPIHDCHEIAHDATANDQCATVRASCVAMCEAIDGGLPHDDDSGTEH